MTGYGSADKKQMQEMVRIQLGLKEIPKPDDAADALAAAITHSLMHQ
jgi:crossover junction endodeoxyribonuclease RuvC